MSRSSSDSSGAHDVADAACCQLPAVGAVAATTPPPTSQLSQQPRAAKTLSPMRGNVVVCYRWNPYAGYPLTYHRRDDSNHKRDGDAHEQQQPHDTDDDDDVDSDDNNNANTPTMSGTASAASTTTAAVTLVGAARALPPPSSLGPAQLCSTRRSTTTSSSSPSSSLSRPPHAHESQTHEHDDVARRRRHPCEAKRYYVYCGSHLRSTHSPSTSMASCDISYSAAPSTSSPLQPHDASPSVRVVHARGAASTASTRTGEQQQQQQQQTPSAMTDASNKCTSFIASAARSMTTPVRGDSGGGGDVCDVGSRRDSGDAVASNDDKNDDDNDNNNNDGDGRALTCWPYRLPDRAALPLTSFPRLPPPRPPQPYTTQQPLLQQHYVSGVLPYVADAASHAAPPPPPPCVPVLLHIRPFMAVHAACLRWRRLVDVAAYDNDADAGNNSDFFYSSNNSERDHSDADAAMRGGAAAAAPWQCAARRAPCVTLADVGDDVVAWYARAMAWWSCVCGDGGGASAATAAVSAAPPPTVMRAVLAVRGYRDALATAMLHTHAGATL